MPREALALPPAASLKAVLFDIDGTLTDSDPLHFEVFKALFSELGLPELGINRGDDIDMHFFHKHISGRWGFRVHVCPCSVRRRQVSTCWQPQMPLTTIRPVAYLTWLTRPLVSVDQLVSGPCSAPHGGTDGQM